jgi:RecB family exonuclease
MPTQYSVSRLGTFRTCPRKYKFQYIEKIRIPDRVSAVLYMGAAVHRQLAKAYTLGSDGVLYPLEDMVGAYKAEWEKTGKEKIEVASDQLTVDDYIRNGEEMLRRFYEKYQPFNQGKLLGAELFLRFQLPGAPYRFVAVIDRLWKRDDGVVEICDYKTGKNLPQGPRDPYFYRQMGLYQLAVKSIYPQFEQIEQAQYFLKHDEIISHRMSTDELDELAEEMRQDVLQTIQAERLDDFPTQEGGHCNYCEFVRLCPAKRHRLIIDAEEEASETEKASMKSAAELADKYVAVDGQLKQLRAEHDALKEDIIRAASDLGFDTLAGRDADIAVRSAQEEQFAGKSADPQAFIQLTKLVRDWQLDECFTLDTRALMKEFFRTERLSPERLDELRKYVVSRESHRVTIRRRRKTNEEE